MTLKVHTAPELAQLTLPPRRTLLEPWLPEGGLAMIYAARGVGKSHLALAVAKAVASGEDLLGWSAGEPRSVLYVDGEMQAVELRDRMARLPGIPPPEGLQFLVADLQTCDLPCLASREGQNALFALCESKDLIVLDNLASLVRRGAENETEGWRPIQDFLLRLRRSGKTVIVIHHAGKGGDQRGTSAREDVMDTVVKLVQPDDYSPEDGARFEIHFTKNRGFFGSGATAFEARLDATGWIRTPLKATQEVTLMQAMRAEGKSMEAIGLAVGCDKSTVSRRLRAAHS